MKKDKRIGTVKLRVNEMHTSLEFWKLCLMVEAKIIILSDVALYV